MYGLYIVPSFSLRTLLSFMHGIPKNLPSRLCSDLDLLPQVCSVTHYQTVLWYLKCIWMPNSCFPQLTFSWLLPWDAFFLPTLSVASPSVSEFPLLLSWLSEPSSCFPLGVASGPLTLPIFSGPSLVSEALAPSVSSADFLLPEKQNQDQDHILLF